MKAKYLSKRLVITSLILFLLTGAAYAASTFQWAISGTTTLLLSPNSIASNGFTAASATYNNTIGATGNGYTFCRFEAVLAFPASPSANAAVYLWILESLDGTNFAVTPTATITTSPPSVIIPIANGTGVTGSRQTVTTRCPPGQWKLVAQLNGTGQTTNASGNTIAVQPFIVQSNP